MARSATEIRAHILTVLTRTPDLTLAELTPCVGPRMDAAGVSRHLSLLVARGDVRTCKDTNGDVLRYRRAD